MHQSKLQNFPGPIPHSSHEKHWIILCRAQKRCAFRQVLRIAAWRLPCYWRAGGLLRGRLHREVESNEDAELKQRPKDVQQKRLYILRLRCFEINFFEIVSSFSVCIPRSWSCKVSRANCQPPSCALRDRRCWRQALRKAWRRCGRRSWRQVWLLE